MVLADTSVWIHHFRRADPELSRLLDNGQIAMHPFVLGELCCGNLPARARTLADFGRLPSVTLALNREVCEFVEHRALMGLGIGFIDAHLLASALLDAVPLWTRDRRLRDIAASLEISFS